MRPIHVLLAFILPLAACTESNPAFCESNADCQEPEPFCDLAGDFGDRNSCTAAPSADASAVPDAPPSDGTALVDAGTSDAAPIVCTEWNLPVLIDGVNTAGGFETGPSVSADGLEIFYSTSGVIMSATRSSRDGMFTLPAEVPNVNDSGAIDFAPELSLDGMELFWVRDGMIHGATRASRDDAFTGVQPVVAGFSPSISSDRKTLYFVDALPPTEIRQVIRASPGGAWGISTSVTASEDYDAVDISADDRRLLMSGAGAPVLKERTSPSAPFGSVIPINGLEFSGGSANEASWGPDELEIYMDMFLKTGVGMNDVYVAACNL